MKNVFLTLVFAAVVLSNMSFYAASPVVLKFEDGVFVLQDEYKEIKVTELPKAVTDAVATDFSKATIAKAYVNEAMEYKLELTMDGTMETVHVDAKGNWIKK
ncbi:conserved hypothetical protein (DUF2874) [Formosa agariphila KMM 3901]|uniref:Beta-lactamase-inhibitor-like PepSY-like domain-containing protein n=1 Tax=Formosa agariphila (strain DSM 15362 / KCTC 12365 / LMG 23005 / KMM 3901 / M-2Alg 35-1) TaxID=1347342 RepID=T2KKQ7_FORAG|nr:hypothetical protein [Formosa agariphila]CDF79028.1 conserved hypothetical protein (DUF2874) [Formosa agariphila KMM 3901]